MKNIKQILFIGLIIIACLAAMPIRLFDPAMPGTIGGTTPAAGTFTNLDADEGKFGTTTRVTINDGANEDGITFGSLGTATKGIDLSSSGLSGNSDYLIYMSAEDYWAESGILEIGNFPLHGVNNTLHFGHPTVTTLNVLQLEAIYNNTSVWRAPNNYIIKADQVGTGALTSILLNTTARSPVLVGNSAELGIWVGDGVSSAGTANITDVGGAAHGLSLAVGDLAYISNCTTASHKGFYRIVTAGATTVVLDRVLAATDTDLTVAFYKDVIGFFATDGTNGQRIMNYSHQDKPLQIGGDVLQATTGMGSEDVLMGGTLGIHTQKVTAGSGAGITVNNSGVVNRQLYKVTTTYAAYTDADTTKGIVIATLPAKMKIVGVYADTTAAYTGGATNAATMVVGITAESAAEIIASHNVFAGAILAGDADAEMGTSMTRAAAIQGGYLPSWSGTTAIYATLVIVNDILSNLAAGSTTFYVETEQF